MASLTLNANSAMMDMIHELQPKFGAADEAEMIRKALLLAKIAADRVQADGKITLQPSSGEPFTVDISR